MPLENTAGLGVQNNYGVRNTNRKFGGIRESRGGAVKELEFVFDYDALPAYGASNLEITIPAGAVVKTATFQVITAFAGGTALAVGIADSDGGSNITDVDGLFNTTELALANIDAAGDYIVGSAGAVLGTVIGEAAEVTVTATGTFTAGKARLFVEYVMAAP